MSEITVSVKTFGVFRKYGDTLNVTCPSGSSVQDVKNRLATLVEEGDRLLVFDSAMANDNEVLGGDAVFLEDTGLAILPPVCGG